jgi:hypothetical protein
MPTKNGTQDREIRKTAPLEQGVRLLRNRLPHQFGPLDDQSCWAILLGTHLSHPDAQRVVFASRTNFFIFSFPIDFYAQLLHARVRAYSL